LVSAHVDVLPHAYLGPEGIGDSPARDTTPWSKPASAGAHARTSAAGAFSVDARGNFTLEAMGVSGRLVGAEGSWEVRSGHWERSMARAGGAGTLHDAEEVFLRIEAVDATLSWGDDGGALQWSGPAVDLTLLSGIAELADASGSLGETQVNAPFLVLDPPVRLSLRPTDRQLEIAVAPLGAAALAGEATGVVPIMQGALAGGAVLAAGGTGVARAYRRRHVPRMADVEAALEEQAYRRAARDARASLRVRPEAEDARLGLAIALSKRGRHDAVVREVEPFVGDSQPSDGVLYYVLGLSQHELGKDAEARSSFREAVRRTPSLKVEVQRRLGKGPAPPVPPLEPSGYA
jgi:tetratricopeptide (TPR) repeat protein